MLPAEILTKRVTGYFENVYNDPDTGEIKTRPLEGLVKISAAADRIVYDDTEYELYDHKHMIVKVSGGYFEAELIVTDQDGINPIGWTYQISPSWKENAVNIPVLEDGPDVININDYFEHPEFPGYVIEKGKDGEDGKDGDDGRSITGFKIMSDGYTARITYSDDTFDEIALPVIGEDGQTVALNYTHVQSNPESQWEITHNLNRSISSVRIYLGDSDDLVLCAWKENSPNHITVYVTDEEVGKATWGTAIVS